MIGQPARQAQWIISGAGLQSLACAGISTGWLKAWLLSAGATEVSFQLLESGTWRDFRKGWQLFYAEEAALMRVALLHGRRIQAGAQGRCGLIGADKLSLINPDRTVWHYQRLGRNSDVLLLPLGDIAYQRRAYLSCLTRGRALRPLFVIMNEDADIALESGLSASMIRPGSGLLNDGGYLPEEQVTAALRAKGLHIRTVESCTGGAIAARLCRLPGASACVDRAWVTYSNQAKCEEAGVAEGLLDEFGAVSEQAVCAMAGGGADAGHVCIAVSGVAGPDGGSEDKPVGTVWIAVAMPDAKTEARCFTFAGCRSEIQACSVNMALAFLLEVTG
jgi:PncC family amidohydrolase